jgi:hypothetical protein
VAAGDWQVLRGHAVHEALAARVLAYADGSTQNFFADGRTLYESGSASWGRWRVEGDLYCSQWPPAERWDCYGVERNGLDIRFVSPGGSVTEGRYVDLN